MENSMEDIICTCESATQKFELVCENGEIHFRVEAKEAISKNGLRPLPQQRSAVLTTREARKLREFLNQNLKEEKPSDFLQTYYSNQTC
jgi:hypothetical protein